MASKMGFVAGTYLEYTRGPTNHQNPGFHYQTNWLWYVKTSIIHGSKGAWQLEYQTISNPIK